MLAPPPAPVTPLLPPSSVLPFLLTPEPSSLLPPASQLLLTLTLLAPQSIHRISGLLVLALVSSHWLVPGLFASLLCGVNPVKKPKILVTVIAAGTGLTAAPCLVIGAAVSAGLGVDARKHKGVMNAVALGLMWGVWRWVVYKGTKEVLLGVGCGKTWAAGVVGLGG